ncbi:MAG: peptidase S41, partial [Paludibacter sp.]|nr:peptidase S41 [Paludibacter sp.]
PRDTTQYTSFLNKAMNLSYLYQFAFKYTDENRKSMAQYKSWQELKKYLDKQPLLIQFANFTASKNLKASPSELNISKNLIINTLQAYIVRNMLGDSGFYPVFYLDDKVVKKAITEIQKK